jgi:diguanylate cyclase (GGDEF)-like protein/PAS domain S-box-containing protein
MNPKRKALKRKTDKFLLLLVAFALILSFLFGYLLKIDSDIRSYDDYRVRLERMANLDYQLNNFFFKVYRYIDYDETSRVTKAFEEDLEFLKKSDLKEKFGQYIFDDILEVEITYKEKLFLLEEFKTLNSRVINSIHYLYDLRKTIEEKHIQDQHKQELLDHVFFTIGKILMDLPYDKGRLKLDMERLKHYRNEHQVFNYFYQHSRQFLSDIEQIKKILHENKEIKLFSAIDHVVAHLRQYYRSNRNEHKFITFSFFVFAFLILVILVFNYRRVRQTTRELQAFRYAIENSDNAIVITNKEREIQYVNEAFEAHSGYKKEEVLGENPRILKSDLLNEDFYKNMNETLDRGEKWQGELINRNKNGDLFYEKSSIVPVFLEGELVQYLAIKLDITDYKEQQQRLQQSAAVYETIGDGILITDSEKKILSVNPAFVKMFGYNEEELVGKEPVIVSSSEQDRNFYKRMWYSLRTKDRWTGKIKNKTKGGKLLPIWLTITVVRDEIGAIVNFIAIYTNLEEIIEMEERAEFLAYHDSLTQLPNRAHFEREIVHIFENAQLKQKMIAVLFIDLDRFKVINDTLGHFVGDEMLVSLSRRIKSILNKDDLFARIGGDEFVIILDTLKTREEVAAITKKILAVIREPIRVQNYHLNTSASIGIALYPDDGLEKNEIIKHADSAMYHAKEKGKNRYEFYTKQLSIDMQIRLDLELELKDALLRKEMYVYFQPQYDLKSGKVIGAEALVRWYNPKLGQVAPDRFISIAEETGMIIEIGYFVFEEACKAYKRWCEQGIALESVSINISSVQFRESNLFGTFNRIIEKVGISAHNIEIEITERFIMEYSTTNLTILEDLRALGCQISIDDFGTGYSSMSYMKSLPLDTIKIDRSFVTDLPYNTHDVEVSKAIIALSKSLGYQVIAEGIENELQEEFLRQNGCDVGQGYYFARPMDADAFAAFVEERE